MGRGVGGEGERERGREEGSSNSQKLGFHYKVIWETTRGFKKSDRLALML